MTPSTVRCQKFNIVRAILSALACGFAVTAQAAGPFPAELDRYIEDARQKWNVPGLAIAVVQNDEVVIAKGYGVRRLGDTAPVDANTRFDIASLTKSFTAAAAAVLIDEGKLRWDDRVRERLPSVVFADPYIDSNVTLRDLLSHRVALRASNAMWYFTRYPAEEVLRRVRFLEPERQFRADMVYSNVMYAVAGEMIARAADTSWAELVRTRLIEPAGMRNTTSGALLAGSNFASPHAVIDGGQRPVAPHATINVAPAGGPGGIISTAADMARWLRLQLNEGVIDGKRVFSKATFDEMHSPQVIVSTTAAMRSARLVEFFGAYGLGWNIMDYRGQPMRWHSGNADGMPVYMAILPKQKLGLVVMINTWAAPFLHGALAARILDSYLGAEPRDTSGEALEAQRRRDTVSAEWRTRVANERVRDTKPSRELGAYEGTYTNRLVGDFHVRREAGGLTLQVAGGEIGDLKHWHYDTFEVVWRDPMYREFFATFAMFDLDSTGKPNRLRIRLNRDELEATRRAD